MTTTTRRRRMDLFQEVAERSGLTLTRSPIGARLPFMVAEWQGRAAGEGTLLYDQWEVSVYWYSNIMTPDQDGLAQVAESVAREVMDASTLRVLSIVRFAERVEQQTYVGADILFAGSEPL